VSGRRPVGAALPASVRAETGRGGLARAVVSTPAARAEVYLQGAHVTAWAPAGQADVIWVSEASAFAPGAPIRGGVPVCFPWFGPHPSGEAPLHGFARTSDWTLVEVTEHGDEVALVLTLSDTEATRASVWPHPFEARDTVTVGAHLTLALAQGSANAVVWNPWIAKAAAMGDFGDDEWTQMVCVETCNVLDGAVTLEPGQSHAMVATVAASPPG
jgi:glucose-6-phosphate 1-epimerase